MRLLLTFLTAEYLFLGFALSASLSSINFCRCSSDSCGLNGSLMKVSGGFIDSAFPRVDFSEDLDGDETALNPELERVTLTGISCDSTSSVWTSDLETFGLFAEGDFDGDVFPFLGLTFCSSFNRLL